METLDVLVSAEARINGMYGSMVAEQNYRAEALGLDTNEYLRLDGPTEPSDWVEIKDIVDPNSVRDMDVDITPSELERMRTMPTSYEYMDIDKDTAMSFYFMCIDVLRNIINGACTMGELYFLSDACVALDTVMVSKVQWWVVHKTAYERLEKSFNKVEKRLAKHKADHEKRHAYLMRIGYTTRKEQKIAV